MTAMQSPANSCEMHLWFSTRVPLKPISTARVATISMTLGLSSIWMLKAMSGYFSWKFCKRCGR